MRKAIAKAMVNSKHTAPHVTLMDEIDVQELWDHRKKFKEIAAEQGTKLTFLPYVVKALVSALKNIQHLILLSMKKLERLYTNITGILVLLQIRIKDY